MSNLENYIEQTLWHVHDKLMDPVKEKLWFEKNRTSFERDLLQNGKLDPKRVFTLIDAIEYRSKEKFVPTGEKRKKSDEVYTIDGDDEYEVTELISQTGYLKPKIQFTESLFTNQDYEKMLDKFDLKLAATVPPEKYTQIALFKNTLETQFDRQASAIVKLHEQIAEEIGSLYSNIEQTMLNDQQKEHPEVFQKKPPEGWPELVLDLLSIFNRIQHGMSPDDIKSRKILDQFVHNKYIDNDLAEEITERILSYSRKREPYIRTLKELIKQLLPLESIIEDFILDQEIKSMRNIWEQDILRDMPNPATFAQKRAARNNYNIGSDVKVMTAALKLLREKLVEYIVRDTDWSVSGIADYMIKNTKDLRPGQKSTVSIWIKKYYSEYETNRNNRLNKRLNFQQ